MIPRTVDEQQEWLKEMRDKVKRRECWYSVPIISCHHCEKLYECHFYDPCPYCEQPYFPRKKILFKCEEKGDDQ